MTDPERFIIASSRIWNRDLPARLKKRTGHAFELLDRPEALNMEHLREINPTFIFFPHWSWIVPKAIHEQFDCVMFHMTDLPYGRGGSPLQNLIVRGHEHTMMSAFRCSAVMDAGPVYLKQPLSLEGSADDIFRRADHLIEDMIVNIIESRPESAAQQGKPVEFHRRKPEDGNIADLETLDQAFDYIRMLDAEGYPSAFIETERLHLAFSQAQHEGNEISASVRITLKPNPSDSETS